MAKLSEIAAHLDLSVTRVSQLVTAGILPKAPRGKHDLDACRASYLKHIREVAAGRGAAYGDLDLTAERARLSKAQADDRERKNAIQDGEYLEVRTFHIMVTSSFAIVRARLLALPSKLAPHLVGIETPGKAHEIVKTEIYAALDELGATEMSNYDHVIELAANKVDADMKTNSERTAHEQ